MNHPDTFSTRSSITIDNVDYTYFSLPRFCEQLNIDAGRLPVSIKILLENMLRNEDGLKVQQRHIEAFGGDPGS